MNINMKIKIVYAFMATLSLLSLGSCKEGRYWDEPADMGEFVAFAKPSVAINVAPTDNAPDSYEVTLSRSKAAGEQTVNVEMTTDYPEVFSGDKTVTFKAGESTATYVIHIATPITPGVSYSVKLAVSNPEDSFVHVDSNNLSFQLSLSQSLKWTSAGEATVTSLSWVEGVSGKVAVEEGNWPVAGERLFRLVDVYFTLEPDYAVSGTNIPFIVDDSGKAVRMFQAWSAMGETNDGDALYFGCPAAYGGSFTNEGNIYTMDGVVGYQDGDGVSPGWYETLVFEYDMPAK